MVGNVTMTLVDPRVNITHQIQAGQIYKDARSEDQLKLVYIDDSHVLLKDEDGIHARLENLKPFEKEVGAGRFKVVGNVEVRADVAYTPVDFSDVPGVGKKTARSLQRAGYTTAEDVNRASDETLIALDGVGTGNLSNMREYIENMDGQGKIQ